MRERGVEPLHPCEYWHLKPARLPIPPLALVIAEATAPEGYPTPSQGGKCEDGQVNLQPLRELLGARLQTDPAVCEGFGIDWTGRYRGEVLAVARPESTDEVAAVLRICNDLGIPVVPQGGNTGLVGGSIPQQRPAIVLSTRALRMVGAVDPVSQQITVGAGVTLAEVQTLALGAGFEYGIDLGARESATIGGTVATNAGGVNVIAYGMTRKQVVGIEAVLPNGDVLSSLRGLAKDNTGYDISQLMCGSEGTLGVITKVRLQLQRPWGDTTTTMIGVQSYAAAIELVRRLALTARIKAAEVFDWFGLELAMRHLGIASPLAQRTPLVLLVEFSGDAELPDPAIVATDPRDRLRLWNLRESLPELVSREGLTHKLDIAVTPAALDTFAERAHAILRNSAVTCRLLFGHLLDGNLHVSFVGPTAADAAIETELLALVADLKGTISAEHGIGTQKVQALHLVRSAQEIATMRAIKSALDPHNIMNPGVLFA